MDQLMFAYRSRRCSGYERGAIGRCRTNRGARNEGWQHTVEEVRLEQFGPAGVLKGC
jgi:hypothetical protein